MRAAALLLVAACSRAPIVYDAPDLAERPPAFPAQCDAPPDAGLGRCDDGHWKWRGPAPVELSAERCAVWSASFDDAWFACSFVREGPQWGEAAIVHWDGARFSTEWRDTGGWGSIAIWGSSRGDLWAVGEEGRILHSDGSGCWVRVPTITAAHLVAVAGRAPDDVWAIGATGTAIHWDGSEWSVSQTDTSADLTAIAVTDGPIWVTTSDGEILRWEGARWRVELSAGARLNSIWADAPDDAWAVGDDGTILRFDGSSWTSFPPDVTGCHDDPPGHADDATHVWGTGPNDVSIACTWAGIHWDGVGFAPISHTYSGDDHGGSPSENRTTPGP